MPTRLWDYPYDVTNSPRTKLFPLLSMLDTIWGSPADEVGIHQGDYITRVNGNEVSSPIELKETIDKLAAGKKVRLIVWRDGQEIIKDFAVAKMANEPPVGHQAWLGIKLSAATAEGVMVSEVMRVVQRRSPITHRLHDYDD